MPLLTFLVNWAIAFNCQAGFATEEVRDVIANLMLSSELTTEQPPISEKLPQQTLSGGLGLSEITSKRC